MKKSTLNFLFLIFFFALSPAIAETYKISISGLPLESLTAVELKLELDPPSSFILSDRLDISDFDIKQNIKKSAEERILFKVVDATHNSIRVFFYKPVPVSSLEIEGDLLRSSYSGDPKINITEINYISDFSMNIDATKLESKIEIFAKEDALPYKGISKAEILGPKERIFSQDIFVTIGNIETYGFDIDSKFNEFKINNQEARLIDSNIIAARLRLDDSEIPESLNITLEIKVDNQTVRKEIGTIEFLENLN